MAFGADVYKEQAVALGHSLRRNYPDCPRAIVTDDPAPFDGLFEIIPLREEFGSNMEQKLHLDASTPFTKTLYIDGDCLVIRSLESVWQRLNGSGFSAVGWDPRLEGQWLGAEVAAVRERLGLQEPIFAFNGGLLYWDGSDAAGAVFRGARELAARYDDLGFGNAGGKRWHMSDEPLFSIAMAQHGLRPLDDSSDVVMRTMINMRGPRRIDVLAQRCTFFEMHNGTAHRVEPAIAPFAGQYTRSAYHRRERARLRWALASPPEWLLAAPPARAASDLALGASALGQQALRRGARAAHRRG